jgi:hypothetical protein
MAANHGKKIRKLYFDVALPVTRTSQTFACTQFAAGTAGDRYGALLQALETVTGSAPPGIKQQRTVSAWFQPTAILGTNTTTPVMPYTVSLVAPTSNVANASGALGNNLSLTALPYLTVGGASVASKAGHEAIYGTAGILRHFAVQVAKAFALGVPAVTTHGVLYVQRQHSIEV